MFDSSLLRSCWDFDVTTSLSILQFSKWAPTLLCLGLWTVVSHLDFGMGRPASQHHWSMMCWEAQGMVLPPSPLLTGFSSLSNDGQNLLQSWENKQILGWNPQAPCLVQLLSCDPPTHGVLQHGATRPCGTMAPVQICPMAWTVLDSHCLQTSPSSSGFTCSFSPATG